MNQEEIQSIGIDVSKKSLDICFLGEKFKVLQQLKVDNSSVGVNEMLKAFQAYKTGENTSFVLEATGSYHVLASLLLKNLGYSVKVFNPIISSKYAGSSVRKCKTDKIDARRIAEIGILENIAEFEITKEAFFLRKNISLLQTLIKQVQVLQASLQQFSEDYENLDQAPSTFFSSAKDSLSQLKRTIKQLEKEIIQEGKKIKGHKDLADIDGVSERSSSIILSQLSDKNFVSKHAMVAYCGLDVSTKKSGTSINGRGKISKRGNTMLRKTLVQAAWGLMMHNTKFKELAEYYKSKGKHYFEIMVIIARKLVHIIYGMLKSNAHFNSDKLFIPAYSSTTMHLNGTQ